ncbi:MAG TPA: helix-turn-helix transcriptional regulator [Pyrinomonadaceae bacterium]|nr:helix-turn-helix transcriptional regulator [Pyrinomonadaceae bacterium]
MTIEAVSTTFYTESRPRDKERDIVSAVSPKVDPVPNPIIDELIEARKKALGLNSTRELGDRFNYHHAKIGKYRNGNETNPRMDNITGMAKVLGISREDFIRALEGKRPDKARLRTAWLAEALEAYEDLTPSKKGEIAILVENLIEAIAKRSKP